jgi:predicted ATP-grasp superfamily ATP-dependent carboligase
MIGQLSVDTQNEMNRRKQTLRTEASGLRILLTEGSSVTVREVIFALGERHTIDIVDPSPFCQARFSRFVRRHIRCPSYTDDPQGYIAFLLDRLRREKYDVLLPTHEEIYLLSRFRDQLTPLVHVALPDFASINAVQGKVGFARLLKQLGLPAPHADVFTTRQALESHQVFPCFVKLDYSTAGSGVRRVENTEQMQEVIDEFESARRIDGQQEILVQQPARGIPCTFYAVFDEGRIVADHCLEIGRPGIGGWAMSGVSASHPMVREHVSQLGEHLRWHGALFVDYFFDRDTRTPQYIECNPRIQAAYHALLSGVELAEQLIQVSCGRHPTALPAGRVGVRFHQTFLMIISRAMEGRNRRQLVSELFQSWTGKGLYHGSTDTLASLRKDWLSGGPPLIVYLLLLANPRAAHWLVRRTVNRYSLTDSAALAIRELTPKAVATAVNIPA